MYHANISPDRSTAASAQRQEKHGLSPLRQSSRVSLLTASDSFPNLQPTIVHYLPIFTSPVLLGE
jgi:hypothetical protein